MKKFFGLTLLLFSSHALGLQIFTCEPEWAALAQELVGEKANIYSATTALQDPHRIEARPSLIAKARRADLVVCTGAELESGWLPIILREAGNHKITSGQPGNFEVAKFVTMLEIPTQLDRADGDVHAEGNPHLQLSAPSYPAIAQALSTRLSEIDSSNADFYRARLQLFKQKWQDALLRWQQQAAPLKGIEIVVQHQAFPYLNAWLGLKQVATLEAKPGLEPSATYLSQVISTLKQHHARMVIRAAYQPPKPSEWIAERTKMPIVVLPFTVGGSEVAKDLFSFFDDTLARLLAGLTPHS